MRNKFKYWIRDFFTLHKSEQRGIIILLFILLFLYLFNRFYPRFHSCPKEDFSHFNHRVEAFILRQKKLEDSLKLIHLQKMGKLTPRQAAQLLHPVPFDPNKISIEQWTRMGLLAKEAKTIRHYLDKGGRFHQKEDLKKIHGLSQAEYSVLAPYIRITRYPEKKHPIAKARRQKTEINSADSARLVQNLLLPPRLAARIVKYRHLLGGYYSPQQLLEVYGMKRNTFKHIKDFVFTDTSGIRRIDVNRASFKQLLHHPYLDYPTTKKLINERNRVHGFQDFRQLKSATGLPDSLLNKIRHYLYLRPLKN